MLRKKQNSTIFHLFYLYSKSLCPFSDNRSDDFLPYEAPPSEMLNGLRLVSWSSVLWLAKPPVCLKSPIETQRILVKRVAHNLYKHGS